MHAAERILVALDFPTILAAATMMSQLRGTGVGSKVGLRINVAAGTPAVLETVGEGTFLDLKFKDIPKTVADAVEAAARQGVKMMNVHCMGGFAMMKAAAEAAHKVSTLTGRRRSLIVGVTILTSLDRTNLTDLGIASHLTMEEVVTQLAIMAKDAGLDGVVCSPKEIAAVRKACGPDFIIVTPGIRGKNDAPDDQKRTLTAAEAIALGATYLVIGRPITESGDPKARTLEFIEEINNAMAVTA